MRAETGVSQELRSTVRDDSGEFQEKQLEYSGTKGEGLNRMGTERQGRGRDQRRE